ncbi:MAG: methionyl-tRNA formyltransferase, partial [Planctomycetota bacterium]|nr:methionyl-tRNA formyltransferase [Planctomycetota bacterium]
GRSVTRSPLAQLAEDAGVPLTPPGAGKVDPDFLARLRGFEPEVLVVASYGVILREDVLELAPQGALNVHASLLPRWRGASPIQRAILAGDAETGVSVQRMVLALDAGDVLHERRVTIGARETSGELLARLAELGGEAIVEALDLLDGGAATFTPQDAGAITLAPKLTKEDGLLDWTRPAAELDRHVRALSPWPGTRTSLPDGRDLGVLAAEVVNGAGAPGTLLEGPGMSIATGAGALSLVTVKPAGKGAMDAAAFQNGARLAPGTVLGTPA